MTRSRPSAVLAVLAVLAGLVPALTLGAPRASATNGTEAGLAVRAGWPQLTADPSTGGSLSLNEGTTSGHSGWYKLGSPTVADLFKNGKKEIVIGSEDGRLYVYNPDGSLAPGWPKRLDAPSMPTSPINGAPAVGDIDGDGHPDIVSGDENGWVFAFNVDGTLKAGWPQFTGWNGDYPNNCGTAVCTGVVSSPTLADLDGDGRMEVIVGSYSHKMWVWRGDGSVLPGWPRDVWDGIASSAAVGDLDGDGSPEIVFGSDVGNECSNCAPFGHIYPGGLVHALRTNGDELPGWPQATDSYMSSSPVLADLNGDGHLEAIVGGGFFPSNQNTRGHHLYAFRGNGSLLWRFDTPQGAAVIHGSPAVGDINGDGHPEIAVGDMAGVMHLLNQNGQEIWSRSSGPSGANGAYFGDPMFADLTGNGRADIVASDANWHLKAWDETGSIVADSGLITSTAVTRYSMWDSPAVGDLDGDGKNEVVLGSAQGDGPNSSNLDLMAGHGLLWVLNTNGAGGLVWPQFQSRVVPGHYHLFTPCPPVSPPTHDMPTIFRNGTWYLRAGYTSGAQSCVPFGAPGDIPVTGDWNNDGVRTIGVFRPSEGKWYLSNSNTSGHADGVFQFGGPGDIPVTGDWNHDGTTTIGVFRPSTGTWYLSNFFDRGFAEGVFRFGGPGDQPIPGDWNQDGTDTLGIFRPSNGTWYITNFFDRGTAEGVFQFGCNCGDVARVWG